jgi:hypothetical protein
VKETSRRPSANGRSELENRQSEEAAAESAKKGKKPAPEKPKDATPKLLPPLRNARNQRPPHKKLSHRRPKRMEKRLEQDEKGFSGSLRRKAIKRRPRNRS